MGLSQAQLGPVDPVMSEHSARIEPVGFIADDIFPPMFKAEEKGQIQVWDRTNLLVPDDSDRAIGAEAKQPKDPEPSYKSYQVSTKAQKLPLTSRELRIAEKQGANAEQVRLAKVSKITKQLMLQREKHLADKLNTAANYKTGLSTVLTNTWLSASGDIVGDIRTAKKALADEGVFANTAAMDYDVWLAIETNPDLLDLTKQTSLGMITAEHFVKIFGLRPVVGRTRYSTSAGVITPVWQDSCIIAFVNDDMDLNDPDSDVTFGRTIMNGPMSFKSYNDDKIDHRSGEWLEGEISFAHEFIYVDNVTNGDSNSGYLIDNAV
jgi:hypothetical protein